MKIKIFFIMIITVITLNSCCCTPYIMYETYTPVSGRVVGSNSRSDVTGYYNTRNEREVIFRNNIPLYRVYNWDSKRYSYYRVPDSHLRYIVRRDIVVSQYNDSYDDTYYSREQKKMKKRNSNKHIEVDTWSTPNGDDETDWLR